MCCGCASVVGGDSCGGDASDLDGVGDGMLVKTVALVASFVVV